MASPPQPRSTPGSAQRAAPAAGAPAAAALNAAIDPIKVLRRHLRLFIATGVVGAVLGVATHFALLRLTPRYTARAQFEYIAQIRSASDIGDTGSNDEIERFMNTQAHVLTQDTVLSQALSDPRVHTETHWAQQFKSGGQINVDKALIEMQDIVRARPIPDTAVVELAVVTADAQDSTNIANAIQSVYVRLQTQKTQNFALEAVEALTRQLNTLNNERRSLEESMQRLMRENSIESWDEDLDTLTIRLKALNPKYIELSENIAILKEQLRQYEEQINAPGGATYPQVVHDEVDKDPITVSLRQNISSLEASLKSSRKRYGDNHRIVRRLRHQIEATQEQLADTQQDLLAEKFAQQIEQTRASLSSFQEAADKMLANIEEIRTKKQEVSRLREQYFTMKADAEDRATQAQELEMKIADERARNERTASTRILKWTPAAKPRTPTFPRLQIVGPGVMILSLGVVGGLVFLRELLEQRVRGPADLKAVPRARVLGVIPDISEDPAQPARFELAALDEPGGAVAESIRQLRAALSKAVEQGGHKTVLFVGGMPGSGATCVVTNLAASLALAERKALVIDANFRRPGVHLVFDMEPAPGLGEVLAGQATLHDAIRPTEAPGLDVLPAGSAANRISERLTTNAISRILSQAREVYDFVLIDTAPAMISSDAMALANRCDAVVLVVRAMGEKRGLISRVLAQLEEMRAKTLGVTINRVMSSAGGYLKRNYRTMHEYQNGSMSAIGFRAAHPPAPSVNGEAQRPPAADRAARISDAASQRADGEESV